MVVDESENRIEADDERLTDDEVVELYLGGRAVNCFLINLFGVMF